MCMKKRIDITIDEKILAKSKKKANDLGLSLSAYIALLLAKEKQQ